MNDEMFQAMKDHRESFAQNNPKMARHTVKFERKWREQLTNAWLQDWREQWGILRTIRNTIGIEEAFTQFYARLVKEAKQ